MTYSVYEVLGNQGPFATLIDNFAVRKQQQEMANSIDRAIKEGQDLVVEAGTGTGKTFAYLVPALLSGRKVIVSTGTKNLQDQLFYKDLPVVRDALTVPVTCALLKGRSNYLCPHFLEKTISYAAQSEREQIPKLKEIHDWSKQTRNGDIAECHILSETDPVWSRVTSTSDNCLGSDCDFFNDCFVVAARREAQAADVVVVNHHLLLSDLSMQEEGFAELLPAADVFIIDEAHQLPEVASQFFGTGISTQQFIDLAQDTLQAYLDGVNEGREIDVLAKDLSNAAQDLRISFGRDMRRSSWSEVEKERGIIRCIEQLKLQLQNLTKFLAPLAERTRELDSCHERACILGDRLKLVTDMVSSEYIHWFEVHRRSVTIHVTPMDIAPAFNECRQGKGGTWIFTSATLAVANNFQHFLHRTGLDNALTQKWDSPFDYQHQSLLYIPLSMPEPNTWQYTQVVIETVRQVLQESQGRAFVLFTSYKALNTAREALQADIEFPLLVQGDLPRDKLLEKFRHTDNAVLLGTSSFWEGVDVRGDALSCVIIDKLPFAAPNDPVLQARLEAIRKQGLNPFMHYQLPAAVIMLKQGAGRLIRDASDRGVLVLCDPRLTTKAYGRTFLQSLPAMPVTRDFNDVRNFFATENKSAGIAT